jgi:RHS repeat-associated protein
MSGLNKLRWSALIITGIAILFGSIERVGAVDGTNYTGAILQQPGFREGLIWIGANAPSSDESGALWNVVTNLSDPSWPVAVESFLANYPASPWAASVHHAYASFCRRTGRITKALNHWDAGWALASTNTDDSAYRVGGTILANWTDLLSSLGRVQELGDLAAAGNAWPFVNPQDRERFQGAQDSCYLMRTHPEIAFRCGTYAVKAVAQTLQPTNAALEDLVEVPSPTNGFSLAGLTNLALARGVNLLAVRRLSGSTLVVPSVVHWQQNHYAAIVDVDTNGNYFVVDPTFDSPKWLPADNINEEASGNFIVPAGSLPSGWAVLNSGDAEAVRGQGLPNTVKDGKDKGCKNPPAQKDCPCAKGAPIWNVSEPYINAWIMDEPMSYLTSRGEEFPFRIAFKQRDTRRRQSLTNEINFVVWTGWNNNWLSTIHMEYRGVCPAPPTLCPIQVTNCDFTVFLPEGGEIDFPAGNSYDSETQTRLEAVVPNGGTFDNGFDTGDNGLRLIHADGSQDIYAFGFVGSGVQGAPLYGDLFRTRHIDPQGNTTWFLYESPGNQGYRIKAVVDYDGQTNRLGYNASSLLVGVTNSYGLSASFGYDANQNLNQITDAQGLVSTLTYDTNSYPTALITPYGTNAFEYTIGATNDGNAGGLDEISRAVRVIEPTGAVSLYAYRYGSPFMPTTYPASDVPTNTPLGTLDDGSGGTNILSAVSFRNSFYWGPRQYASLSTTDLASLSTNDYLKARRRHWLQDTNELFLSGLISMERDPSPDGTSEGLKVFYDYQGKIFRHRQGTNDLPSVIAWRLPGGETHYEYVQHNEFGFVTNDITTFTRSDGTLGSRTNQFVYSQNTYTNVVIPLGGGFTTTNTFTVPNLLSRVVTADGSNVLSLAYDTVSWTNDRPTFGDTNRVILTSQRILPRFITNGVGEVTELSFTGFNKLVNVKSSSGLTTTNVYSANGFLSRTIDLEIGRTNSFSYTNNGLVATFTNELGLPLSATWDGLLRLTNVSFPDGSFVATRYDKLDVGATRDRQGFWTYFGYDGLRHLTAITNANNAITRFSWCGCGSLETISNALNQPTSLTHDSQSRCTGISLADGSSATYQYDLAGRTTNVLDGAGRSFKYVFNNQGLITAVSNAYGRVMCVLWDVRDRPVEVTDANGLTVTNTFDNLDRLVLRSWPGAGNEGFLWSTNGLIAYTNQDHQVTRFVRDLAGRLTAVTNANLEFTLFGYNAAGELITLTDGLNHTTTWHRNEFGLATNKVDALGREIFRFAFDNDYRLTNRWTPEFGNTAYVRDGVGNILSINYPLSTINFSYDPLNQLTNMADQVGTTRFTWTAAGQLQSEDGPWANDTVTNGYTQGLRTTFAINSPQSTINYSYDSARRLQTLASSLAGTFTYGYYIGNNISPSPFVRTIGLPNLAWITNHLDSLDRLDYTALMNRWGHVLDSYSYTHDPLGLRTNIVRDFGLTTNSVSIGYDNIGQLTSWSAKEWNNALRQNEQLGWGYDAAHNLQTRTSGSLLQTFNNDAVNELTNITRTGPIMVSGATPVPAYVSVNGLTADRYGDFTFARTNLPLADGPNTFTNIALNLYGAGATNTLTVNLPQSVSLQFDSNGNLTNDGTRSFVYDAENQLTNVYAVGQWKTEFVYDGLGRRRIARDYGWNGNWLKTNETRYIYDGTLPVQERDSNNVAQVTYTRGLDFSGSIQGGGGIGGLLARTDASGSADYHADGAGNITALMGGNGDLLARYLYNPFGKMVGQWGALANANAIQFSSMPRHANSGLSLYAFRGYDPNLQRWLNRDPIGEAGGLNLYGFVHNSPLNYIDPTGEDFHVTGPNALQTSGPLGYISGDTFLENVGAGLYNTIPTILNPGQRMDDTLMAAASWLDQAIEEGIFRLTGDRQLAQGANNALAVTPIALPEDVVKLSRLARACERVTGPALAEMRKAFSKAKAKFWQNEAKVNPSKYSASDLARMEKGKGPIGPDGKPMELHHDKPLAEGGDNSVDNLKPMSRTDHRLGENYKANHPNLP